LSEASFLEVPAKLPITFHYHPVENKKSSTPLVVFLHGYTDSGKALLRRALKGKKLPYSVLAPNGPFPLPIKAGDHYKEAYAWYFWDVATNKMVIHPEVAVQILRHLVHHLGYENSPKIIVGFSQGGFLMPFLFPQIKNIKGLVGIGCNYRLTNYQEPVSCPLIAIHGAEDQVVPLEASQKSYEELVTAKGLKGEYYVLSTMGHTVDEMASNLLIQKIDELLK
jgi:predicted esterase